MTTLLCSIYTAASATLWLLLQLSPWLFLLKQLRLSYVLTCILTYD
jgi:hypothetical protein